MVIGILCDAGTIWACLCYIWPPVHPSVYRIVELLNFLFYFVKLGGPGASLTLTRSRLQNSPLVQSEPRNRCSRESQARPHGAQHTTAEEAGPVGGQSVLQSMSIEAKAGPESLFFFSILNSPRRRSASGSMVVSVMVRKVHTYGAESYVACVKERWQASGHKKTTASRALATDQRPAFHCKHGESAETDSAPKRDLIGRPRGRRGRGEKKKKKRGRSQQGCLFGHSQQKAKTIRDAVVV